VDRYLKGVINIMKGGLMVVRPDGTIMMVRGKSPGVGLSGMVCGWDNFKSHPITPIMIKGYLMKPIGKERERENKPTGGLTGIITREEYSALMSGLATLASELEHLPRLLEAEKRLRRLEYLMMILVGLLLVVMLVRTG
jgi:hypothetical protein